MHEGRRGRMGVRAGGGGGSERGRGSLWIRQKWMARRPPVCLRGYVGQQTGFREARPIPSLRLIHRSFLNY